MTKHLTPLEVCIHMIGPEPELARICGLNATSPYHWHTSRRWRDGGDLPSSRIQRRLLAHAEASRIPLNPEWLIWGASSAQVEEAMRAAQHHRSAA